MSGGVPPASDCVSCWGRSLAGVTTTFLPVLAAQALPAAPTALVSASPEDPIRTCRVTPEVAPPVPPPEDEDPELLLGPLLPHAAAVTSTAAAPATAATSLRRTDFIVVPFDSRSRRWHAVWRRLSGLVRE